MSSKTLDSRMAVAVFLCLAGAGFACQDLHQKKASDLAPKVSIRVVFPDQAEAAATAGPEAPVIVPTPGATQYHIRLSISNPLEVRYLFDYTPGTIVDLVVASGVQRVISVDGWEVSSAAPPPGMFPARHFITVTPEADRTVNFLGEPVSIVLALGPDPALGALDANPPYLVTTGPGATASLPLGPGCPADQYWMTVTDLDWPLVFPSVPVDLHPGGVPQPYTLAGLAQGHGYGVVIWHDQLGLIATALVSMAGPDAPLPVVFNGYLPPALELQPAAALAGLIPGVPMEVPLALNGGWGGLAGLAVAAPDTCGGLISGGAYAFEVPFGTGSCVIAVSGTDCGLNPVTVTLTAAINQAPPPACMDGADNDADGAVDYPQDPGCTGRYDSTETDPGLPCDDGIDNDGDGLIDAKDPGCANPLDPSELNPLVACDDGIDNDGWGDIDLADPGCASPADPSELDALVACDDGIDNDGWGDADVSDPGCAGPLDHDEWGVTECDDGIDNDGWGDIDVMDPGCTGPTDASEYGVTLCDNGADDDGWGDADSADPGCIASGGPAANSERNPGLPCDDGLDNDNWGDVDWADPGCASASDPDEYRAGVACDDGLDNDGWGDVDKADPGCEDRDDASEYGYGLCDNGVDDDGDGLVDHDDPQCVASNGLAEGSVWFVATDGDNTTGRSWANAFTIVQTAINSAAGGDVVFVKQGTYSAGGAGDHLIQLRSNIDLYGGFMGTEGQLSQRGHPFDHPTILDAQNAWDHVIKGSSYTRMDGFSITGGAGANDEGGGMYNLWCTNLSINNCKFYNNWTRCHGGAVYNYNCSYVEITNSIFANNTSAGQNIWGGSDGGGAALWNTGTYSVFKNCLFYGNNTTGGFGQGGAVTNIGAGAGSRLENCTFAGNNGLAGGALALIYGANATMVNSIFWNNTPDQIWIESGAAAVSYCDLPGGWAGTGNFDADPLFMAGTYGAYYLSPVSPGVDAGDNPAAFYGLDAQTTFTTNVPDGGAVDLGFHYPVP